MGLDPGSFGGHPYLPKERALGYGTDHDPRFTHERMKMGNALNEAAAKLDSAAQELAAVDIDFAQQKEDIAALLESLSSALVGIANALSAAGTAFMDSLAAESQANPE